VDSSRTASRCADRGLSSLAGTALWAAGLLLSICVACGAPSETSLTYPGTLRPPSAFARDFVLRQSITARRGNDAVTFQAVLQKRGNALVVLGLTPYGTRAFLLEQRGEQVSFRSFVDRDLPFPPRFILLDIQRTLLFPPAGPSSDGQHERMVDGDVITERWRGGRLLSRRFRRVDGLPEGEIVVEYGEGMTPERPPPLIRLHNGWSGYDLLIRNFAFQPL